MKTISTFAVILAGSFFALGYVHNYSFAKEKEHVQFEQNEEQQIQAVIARIKSAVQSGDEQIVIKLLEDLILAHPQKVAEIVPLFVKTVASPNAEGMAYLNIGPIINNVASNIAKKPGGEALAAAILDAYTPAAGGNNSTSLPPSLPNPGAIGSTTIPRPSEAQKTSDN